MLDMNFDISKLLGRKVKSPWTGEIVGAALVDTFNWVNGFRTGQELHLVILADTGHVRSDKASSIVMAE